MKAILALEDGSVFHGVGFGVRASACGEVCFNTSMTGYQEILTDPSYKGQIVTMTYPLIGNYGVNREDVESWRPHVAGFVIRELSPVVSNWRSESSLSEYLEQNGIPGIQGIDTRALTRKLRVRGALNGFISTEGTTADEAVKRAKEWPGLMGVDYVKEVTHKQAFLWDQKDEQSANFNLARGPAAAETRDAHDPLPPAATAAETLQYKPAGIFLSNGPGDPAALGYAVQAVGDLIKAGLPIFGICLGHQILGQAFGGKT